MNLKKFFRENHIILLFVAITYITLNILMLLQNVNYIVLDELVRCEVTLHDGSIKEYNRNIFPTINKGEQVIATIPILYDTGLDNPAVCFHIYNCTFELKYEDEILFSAGEDLKERNAFIGNHYGNVVLPKEVMGEELTLTCVATENSY